MNKIESTIDGYSFVFSAALKALIVNADDESPDGKGSAEPQFTREILCMIEEHMDVITLGDLRELKVWAGDPITLSLSLHPGHILFVDVAEVTMATLNDKLVTSVEFEECPYCMQKSLFVAQERRFQECVICGHFACEEINHYPEGVVCIVPKLGFGGREYHAPTPEEIAEYDRLSDIGALDLDESYIVKFVGGAVLLVRGVLPC